MKKITIFAKINFDKNEKKSIFSIFQKIEKNSIFAKNVIFTKNAKFSFFPKF